MGCKEQKQACTWRNREGTFLVTELQLLLRFLDLAFLHMLRYPLRQDSPSGRGGSSPAFTEDRRGHGFPDALRTKSLISQKAWAWPSGFTDLNCLNRLRWTGSGGRHQHPHFRRSAGRYEASVLTSHQKLMVKYVTYAAFAMHASEISESI